MNLLQKILRKMSGDKRSVSDLIHDLAFAKQQSDVDELYRRLPSLELYAKLAHPVAGVAPGPHVVQEGENVRIQFCDLPNGWRVLPFHVVQNDSRLGTHFIGIPWRDAAEIVLEDNSFAGMLLTNAATDWFVVPRADLSRLLAQYRLKA